MSTDQNKALARRLYNESWNAGSFAAIDEIVASNFLGHDTENPLLPDEVGGVEGIKRSLTTYRTAFPDVHFMVQDQVAEGDKVVTRFVATGTQTGPLGRIPPTGRRTTVTGIYIDRFTNGRLVESWSNFDALGLLAQLGVLPLPARS